MKEHGMAEKRSLEKVQAGMAALDPGLHYYAFTFTADPSGKVILETLSHWVGWADVERHVEIRKPSLVNADGFIKAWRSLGEPYLIVMNDPEWCVFYMLGGHALVEKNTAEANLRNTLAPEPSVRPGQPSTQGTGSVLCRT